MKLCDKESTDPAKHAGPFKVDQVLDLPSGSVANEACARCGGLVRRSLPGVHLDKKKKKARAKRPLIGGRAGQKLEA